MKKVFLTLVAVVSMSMNVFAAPADSNERTMVALEKALNLDGYQSKVTAQAGITFQEAVKSAMESSDQQARSKQMKQAALRNLRSVRSALDEKQYKKYVQVLNATLENHGLRGYMK